MNNFFAELKRRNVVRVAVAYAVVAWVIMQFVDIVAPLMGLPDVFQKGVMVLLVIGAPIALLLSWAYEVTPEGVKKTHEVDKSKSITHGTGQKINQLIIGALVLALAFIAYEKLVAPVQFGDEENTVREASIAVLPFTDLSAAGDQEYFSDGIAEEILNVLTRVGGLKVASRTSAFGFKGQEALGIPLIAERLQVRYVLEGSVRKSGNTIRITAQIIDAAADQHLWSESYDRELTADNIFAIQDEIATAIVAQLSDIIGNNYDLPTISVKADTQNLSAYETYLEARALFARRNRMILPVAIAKLELTVATDPNFARAWALLSASYSVAPSWGVRDRDYVPLSNRAADRAIELNPELSLPYAVLGRNLTEHPPGKFTAAFVYYEQALQRDPNNATVLLWRGEGYIAAGYFKEAEENLKRCLEIDPSYHLCGSFLAKLEFNLGRKKQAFARYSNLVTEGSRALTWVAAVEYAHAGENDLARWALARFFSDFSLMHGRSDILYRALTDSDFDFEKEAAMFEIEYRAIHGNYDVTHYPFAFILKQYDQLTAYINHTIWWNSTDPEFRQSPHRKRLIREAGLPKFWRENGYPPQCRAVGADDFECD